MRKQFGDYLLKFDGVANLDYLPINGPENTKAVVWLEDETSFWVKPVLQNFAHYLGTEFNYYFFCTPKNYEYVKKIIDEMGWKIEVKLIQDLIPNIPIQMSADTFNQIYKDPRWWNYFKEDYILTAQLDTILLRPWNDKWLQYDMIGAPCNFNTFNGGLCLRNRKKMLECLELREMDDINRFIAEDVFYTFALRNLIKANVPTREEATAFSIENFPTNVTEFCSTPFGIHGANKYYLPDQIVDLLLAKKGFKIEVGSPNKPKVFLCSPVYKWPPHPKFAESVEACKNDPRMEVEFRAVSGDAHIERARAMLLEQYLRYDKPWDWMVMIDSDIEFNPDIIWGIINRGKDCIGAAYAFKSPEGTPKYRQPVIRGLCEEEKPDKGLLKIRYLGGGFTICSDKMIKKLCEHYDDLKMYINPDIKQGDGSGLTYALWNPILIEQPDWGSGKKEMLSEDYSFCQRILDMGEEVWLDLCAVINHWDGDKCYSLETVKADVDGSN